MAKGSSAVNVPCEDMFGFYKKYLLFIRPLHPVSRLGDQQIDILACLLTKRFEICKTLKDVHLIGKLLFSLEVRNSIMESLGISSARYYNVVARFRKFGIIEDGDFNKKLLPDLNGGRFSLHLAFVVRC